MAKKITFVIALFLTVLILTSDDTAKLKVNGTSADINKFKEMLRKGAFGNGSGSVNIDSAGNVTLTGTPSTFFGARLRQIINDTVNCVEIFLEDTVPDGRKVTVGAWRRGQGADSTGNGKQSIDLGDIEQAPDRDSLGVSTQQAMIIHELWEAYIGLRDSLRYGRSIADTTVTPGAHDKAMEAENGVIKEQNGGREYRRVRDRFIGRYLYVYYHCIDTTVYRRLRLCFTSDGEIEDITPGFVHRYTRQFITNGPSTGGIQYFNDTHGTIEPGIFDGTFEFQGFNYIITDYQDNYFVSLPAANGVLRIAKDGTVLNSYQHADLTLPQGITYNRHTAELFVADENSGHIVVFDSSGNHKRTLNLVSFNIPADLDLDERGNIFVSGHGSDSIYHITSMGEMLNSFGHPDLMGPAGIDYGEVSRLLFVVSNTNDKVLVFNADGTFETEFPTGTLLSSPWGIALEGGTNYQPLTFGWSDIPVQRVVVASTGTNSLVSFLPNGNVDQIYTTPDINPMAVALDLDTEEEDIITGIDDDSQGAIPERYDLKQNYPNPFNPSTTITFSLPKAENVKLIIYNILGEKVNIVVDNQLAPGNYKFRFDAANLPSGVYFYNLKAGEFSETKKMLLLR